MSNDDLVFYVKLYVKPDCVEEWRKAFDVIVEEMSKEDAFISCYLHQDAYDETLFTLYERWAEPSVESFLENQMKPYRIEYDAKLETLLQRPREPQILRSLGIWDKHRN
jgi:quinol monooxygenase YgiN